MMYGSGRERACSGAVRVPKASGICQRLRAPVRLAKLRIKIVPRTWWHEQVIAEEKGQFNPREREIFPTGIK